MFTVRPSKNQMQQPLIALLYYLVFTQAFALFCNKHFKNNVPVNVLVGLAIHCVQISCVREQINDTKLDKKILAARH